MPGGHRLTASGGAVPTICRRTILNDWGPWAQFSLALAGTRGLTRKLHVLVLLRTPEWLSFGDS